MLAQEPIPVTYIHTYGKFSAGNPPTCIYGRKAGENPHKQREKMRNSKQTVTPRLETETGSQL